MANHVYSYLLMQYNRMVNFVVNYCLIGMGRICGIGEDAISIRRSSQRGATMTTCPKCQSAAVNLSQGLATCKNRHMWRESNPSKRAGKYNAKKVVIQGVQFDSTFEGKRWMELQAMEAAGEIEGLRRQVYVYLTAGIKMIIDYAYLDKHNVRVWEDAKGVETAVFKLKKRLWAVYGPGPLLLSSAKCGVYQVVTPGQPVPKTKRKTKKRKP